MPFHRRRSHKTNDPDLNQRVGRINFIPEVKLERGKASCVFLPVNVSRSDATQADSF